MKLKNKFNSENNSKQEKYRSKEWWLNITYEKKENKIEKKNQFYKSFQIKQIIIKRTWTKFKGKTNWSDSSKIYLKCFEK